MNDVRMPIKTIREGNKITKICVEDVYKMINRVQEALDKSYNNSMEILDSIHKIVDEFEGELIIGTGVSQPCLTDAFDEEIGNNIAFMKCKLNANIKKHNVLVRVWNELMTTVSALGEDLNKVDGNICRDLNGVRQYNPDYLSDIEYKLGIFPNYEV